MCVVKESKSKSKCDGEIEKERIAALHTRMNDCGGKKKLTCTQDQRPTNKPNVSHNIFEMRKVEISKYLKPFHGDHLDIIDTNCHGSKFQRVPRPLVPSPPLPHRTKRNNSNIFNYICFTSWAFGRLSPTQHTQTLTF